MIRFLIATAALTLILPSIVTLGFRRGWLAERPSFLFETTLLVAFATAVIFLHLYRSKKPSFFVQLYLLTMAVKLIAFFGYNLIMILDDKKGAMANVLYFLLVYFIFTAVEIAFLYKRISGKPGP